MKYTFGKTQKLLKMTSEISLLCLGVPSGEGCWKAIIFPPIPLEGVHSCTFVLQSDSNKCIYLGVKREECTKTED